MYCYGSLTHFVLLAMVEMDLLGLMLTGCWRMSLEYFTFETFGEDAHIAGCSGTLLFRRNSGRINLNYDVRIGQDTTFIIGER